MITVFVSFVRPSGVYRISSDFGTHSYMFYSRRDALAKYRKQFGLVGKHLNIIDL